MWLPDNIASEIGKNSQTKWKSVSFRVDLVQRRTRGKDEGSGSSRTSLPTANQHAMSLLGVQDKPRATLAG
jgi:hypothetical protein